MPNAGHLRPPSWTRAAKIKSILVCLVCCVAAIKSADPSKARELAKPLHFPWEPRSIPQVPEHVDLSQHSLDTKSVLQLGKAIFLERFSVTNGFGRPSATGNSKPTNRLDQGYPLTLRTSGPDANSCAGCHNQPSTGGSGDFVANAFVGAQLLDPPTYTISPSTANERNTISIFGAGLIELLAREMTADLHQIREAAQRKANHLNTRITATLLTKGVSFGTIIVDPHGTVDLSYVDGVDPDLVIKPFGSKGIAISIREFTNAALNHHHGIQTLERFGSTRTGVRDFDEDGVEKEMSDGQVTALTLFQAALPRPVRAGSTVASKKKSIESGNTVFKNLKCDQCHRPTLPLRSNVFSEPNPFNRPGSLRPDDKKGSVKIELDAEAAPTGVSRQTGSFFVAAFTDLKRHRICDAEINHFCNEQIIQESVPLDEFLTAKLWDVGSSAPYGHRGDLTTITEAIMHHGGEARPHRYRFIALSDEEKGDLIAFLRTLKVCVSNSCQ